MEKVLNKPIVVPPVVIAWLEEHFPDKLPKSTITQTELAHLVGQQSVIEALRQLNETEED